MTAPRLYANEESVLTRNRKALVYRFKNVHRDQGYKNTVGDVLTEVRDPSDLTNFPVLILVRGDTVIENEDQSEQLWHKRIPYLLLAFIRDQNDPTLARETLLQDLEQVLGASFDGEQGWTIRDEAGVETCRIASLDGDKPFGMFMNKPQVGFAFRFSVRLAQDILDPTVAG